PQETDQQAILKRLLADDDLAHLAQDLLDEDRLFLDKVVDPLDVLFHCGKTLREGVIRAQNSRPRSGESQFSARCPRGGAQRVALLARSCWPKPAQRAPHGAARNRPTPLRPSALTVGDFTPLRGLKSC